ncbi:MAG: MBL fold metallo-hydrolase [Myxococcota bacterium]
MRLPIISLTLLLLVAATTAGAASKARTVPADAELTLTHGEDPRVGTYVSSSWGFSTNSFWIEGPKGLILVDTQFLPSAAEEFVNWAEQVTGKKAVMAFVLHANPDKFNGTATLKKRGIKVVTSEQVRALMPEIHEKRVRAFYDRYQPDYPKDLTLPDSFGNQTTEIEAAGLKVKAHVMGAGCSNAHVVLEWEKHIFVGDLIANGNHSWLEIGRTDEWLKRIEEMRALKPDFVHPGRGPAMDARLLDQEEVYLKKVVELVAAEKPRGEPDEKALDRVKSQMEALYPAHRYAIFLNIGLPAEWRRQAAATGKTP